MASDITTHLAAIATGPARRGRNVGRIVVRILLLTSTEVGAHRAPTASGRVDALVVTRPGPWEVGMQHQQVMRVLNGPLAQELLASNIPARLAYTGRDGAPRAIPIAFHWDGARFVVCTPPNAAKVRALQADPRVALTIDTNAFPPQVLLVRGTAELEIVAGIPPEYLAGSRKIVGDEGMAAFEEQVRGLYEQMARIAIEPEWAKLLDFETTIPSAVEELMQRRPAGVAAG
jgi:hypothetical protein